MKRHLLVLLLISVATILVFQYAQEAYEHTRIYFNYLKHRPTAIGLGAGPINVSIGDSTDWPAVFKALVTVLGTYLGIKLINKYVK